ncbi:MAG: heme exporter protein CcmD [Alphaproteobacteria bacterium]|nr:heme exporter protein CcmD [Alphaproteobacteria bacterium]
MISFWEMGGYAIYVWPAYGVTLLVLALNILTVFLDDSKTTAP